jgi:hypothetical protein
VAVARGKAAAGGRNPWKAIQHAFFFLLLRPEGARTLPGARRGFASQPLGGLPLPFSFFPSLTRCAEGTGWFPLQLPPAPSAPPAQVHRKSRTEETLRDIGVLGSCFLDWDVGIAQLREC